MAINRDAAKAVYDAVYNAAMAGKPISQGAANKIYDKVVQETAPKKKETPLTVKQAILGNTVQPMLGQSALSPAAVNARDYAIKIGAYTPPVSTTKPEKTNQQKYEEAKTAYDSYMESEEYQNNRKAANKVGLQDAITSLFSVTGGITSDNLPKLPAGTDAKEEELRATANYYKQQMDAEENQKILETDLQELATWSDEDRRNLDKYIAERDTHTMNALNPFVDQGFDTYNTNPIVSKYGIGKVRQMAESLQRSRNAETTKQVQKAASNIANNDQVAGGIAGSVLSVPASFAGSITSPLSYAVELGQRTGRYSTLDPNNIGNAPSVFSETVRGEVAGNIRGDENNTNWLRQLAAIGYQGGMSALDSAARTIASGGSSGVSAAIASSGAFGSSLRQYSQQGVAPAQAAAMALTNAGLEYITEKIPTEKVLDMFKKGNTTGAVKNILQQAFLVEPTSEEVNLFAGVAAEALILGDKSSNNQRLGELIANGMSYEEAKAQIYKELWKEAAQTYAVSAFSGGLSAAGATLAGDATQRLAEMTGAELAQNAPAPAPAQPMSENQQHLENGIAATMGVDNSAQQRYDVENNQEGMLTNGAANDYGANGRNAEVDFSQPVAGSTKNGGGNVPIGNPSGLSGTEGQGIVYTRDSEGREVSPYHYSKIQGTAVRDANGAPIAMYHFTDNMDFDVFNDGDVGFHFGTQEQANKRSTDKKAETGRTFRAYLNIKNPVRVNQDIMGWHPAGTALRLWSDGVLTEAEMREITGLYKSGDRYNSSSASRLREILESKGFDGIAYPNAYEGQGDSYIAFHDDQIVRTGIENTGKNTPGVGVAEQKVQVENPGDHAVGAMKSQFKHEVKDSKVYENTYKNATDEEIRMVGRQAKEEDPNIGKYDAVTEEESLHAAELRTETAESQAEEYDYLMQKDGWSGEDNDTAAILLKKFRQEENIEAFINLAKKQREQGTQAGQMIQSFAKYSREDATVAVQDAIADLDELTTADVAKRFLKNESDFDTWKKDVSKDMLSIANDIESVKDGDKTGMLDIVRQLANYRRTTAWAGSSNELTRRTEKGLSKMDFATLKTVAKTQLSMIPNDFIKRNAGDIANALRYQNMLFSVTTMLKNHSGNISNGIMDSVSDSSVGQFADFVISKFTGKRTVGSDVKYAPEYVKAARDAADVAAAFVSLDIPMDDGTKYVKGNTRTWSPNSNLFGRMLSAYEKHLRYSLEVSDKFYEGGAEHTVKKSLERLGEKSGLTQKQIDSLAESTALRRTFKDPGFSIGKDGKPQKGRAFARASVGMQKSLNNIGTDNFGAGDVLMPFAAVSAEVKQVGMDYTGAGLVSGLKEMISIAKDAKAGKTIDPYRQRSAATNFGRGVTGVALTAAFAAIAAAGAVKVHSSRKQEEKIMEQTQGLSGAQWNINAALRYVEAVMNGKTFEEAKAYASWQDNDVLTSIDFLEPFNTQMHIGYLLSQDTDILTAIARGNFEALLEMPMMQTLSDAADLLQAFTEVSEGDMGGVLDATGQLLGTVAGSAIPNWLRQTTKVIDPNYRDTYDTDPIQKAIKEVIAGVPFASKQLPKKYDTLGEEQKRYENGELLKAAIETMVTPWDTQKYDTNTVYQEIERLNAIDGINVTPPKKARKLTYTDKNGAKHENYNLTAEEYETMQKAEGQTAARVLNEVTTSADYAALSDAQKAKVVDHIYDYAREQGRVEAVSDYLGYKDSWMKNIGGKEAKTIVKKVVGADIKGAMDAMSNAWANGFDDAESLEALEAAYKVYSNMSQATRKAVKDDATGRVAAYMEARNNRIKTETFVDLYKTYWELDKSGKKQNDKAEQWAYTLEKAQESGKLTATQKDALKESLGFSQTMRVETEKFDALSDSGLSANDTQTVTKAINSLIPEDGKSQVSDIQKWDAICKTTLDDVSKDAAIKTYMQDYDPTSSNPVKTELKYDYIRQEMDLSPESYTKIYKAYTDVKNMDSERLDAIGTTRKEEYYRRWTAEGMTRSQATELYNLFVTNGKKKIDVVAWYEDQQ